MRIKVTSLAIFHKKERHGLQKRERITEQKALVFKERERERKRKVAMPSQKEARGEKLLKGVPFPPNIPHICTS
jgi:hypothetical protein